MIKKRRGLTEEPRRSQSFQNQGEKAKLERRKNVSEAGEKLGEPGVIEDDRENFKNKERVGIGVLTLKRLVPLCLSLCGEWCGSEELSVFYEESKGARCTLLFSWADRSSWASGDNLFHDLQFFLNLCY